MINSYFKTLSFRTDADRGVSAVVDLHPQRVLKLVLALQAVLASCAWAQLVPSRQAAPGSSPVVEANRQGADVVHIAPPSAAGVSHNRYQQFNVAPGGLILNNSAHVTDTALGGRVSANPHLGGQSARVILNEVTSASQSTLRGAIEVAGRRADVIVANPNGIMCDGCGFLNVGRATLTTGSPRLGKDGSVQSFGIEGGHLSIGAGGLDARGLQQLDLLARGIVIDGPVQAERIYAITGANKVNYAETPEVGSEAYGSEKAPKFAIDIGELGSMHARQIYLLATERGVGVNSVGRLTATEGDLRLSSDGDLRVHDVYGEQGVTLGSVRGELALAGTIASPDRVDLSAGQTIHNRGSVKAGERLLASAPQIRNSGTVTGGTSFGVGAGSIELKGQVFNTAGARVFSSGDLTIDGSLHNVGGEVHALGDMNIVGRVDNENADLRVERHTSTRRVSEVSYADERALEAEFNANEVRIDSGQNLILPSETYPFDRFGHEPYDFDKLAADCANGGLAGQPCGSRLGEVLELFGLPSPEARDTVLLAERRTALLENLKPKLEAFNSDLATRRSERYFVRTIEKQVTTEDRVVASQPGQIIVGGGISVAGGSNVDSRIVAGGAFSSSAGFENRARKGERTVTAHGSVQSMVGKEAQASNQWGGQDQSQSQSLASVVSSELFALDVDSDTALSGFLSRKAQNTSSGSSLSAVSVQVHAHDQAFINSGFILAHGGAGGGVDSSGGVIQVNAGRIEQNGEMASRAMILRAETDIVVSGGQTRGVRAPESIGSLVSLEAGRTIELRPAMRSIRHSEGDEQAFASLASRQSMIVAQTVRLRAGQDLTSGGALVKAGENIEASATRHIDIGPAFEERTTEVAAAVQSPPSHWRESRMTAQPSRFEAGRVVQMTAGQELTFSGSHAEGGLLDLRGQGVAIDAALTEQRVDVQTVNGQQVQHIDMHRKDAASSTLIGGTGATIRAESDLQITGSEIKVMNGQGHLSAGRDLRLRGAVTNRQEVGNNKSAGWSWLSHGETDLNTCRPETGVSPAGLEGSEISLKAGRDLSISASTVSGYRSLKLEAGKDLTVGGEQHSHSEHGSTKSDRRTGLIRNFGINGLLGRRDNEEKTESSTHVVVPTTVGSIEGDVSIDAKGTYRQAGGDLLANGDVTVHARDIELVAAEGSNRKRQNFDFQQYGVTLGPNQKGVAGSLSGAFNQGWFASTAQSRHAQILRALSGLRLAYRGYSQLPAARDHAYDVASQVPVLLRGEIGSFLRTLRPSVGLAWDDSRENPLNETVTSIRESTISAGGKLSLQGNSESGSIRTAGAQVIGGRVELDAGKIELGAASSRKNHAGDSYSAGMGAAYEIGGNAGASAFGYYAGGATQGSAQQYKTTHVTAKTEAVVSANADISFRGASLDADSVTLKAGGSLSIETLQDLDEAQAYRIGADTYAGVKEHYSAGIGLTGGRGALRYAMATSPSRVLAGPGGFNIEASERISLTGGVIESLAAADKNRIVTGTLQSQNIDNVSGHDAFFLGGNVGYDQSQVESISESAAVPGFSADAARSVTRSFIAPSAIILTKNSSESGEAKTLAAGAQAERGESMRLVRQPDIGDVLLRQHQVAMAIGALGPDGLAEEWNNYADTQQRTASESGNIAAGWARDGWWRQAGHAVIDLLVGRWWTR